MLEIGEHTGEVLSYSYRKSGNNQNNLESEVDMYSTTESGGRDDEDDDGVTFRKRTVEWQMGYTVERLRERVRIKLSESDK